MTPAPARLADPLEAAVAVLQAVLAADLAATTLVDELLHALYSDNPGDEDRTTMQDALFMMFELGARSWYGDPT